MFGQLRMRFNCVLLVVTGMLLVVADQALAVVVTFPDANLEAKVRATLSIPAPTPITDTNMQTMGSFYADSSGISDLRGLEHAVNLFKLLLPANQINDISPVSGLTDLINLQLHGNQVDDISAIAGLTKLIALDLCHNEISDISAVSGLTQLTYLHSYSNQISDISALSGLTSLDSLALGTNQIGDISPIAGLTSLTTLSLHTNQVNDISAVGGLTNLNKLYLFNNQISDISAVSGLTNLTYLDLGYNEISDISAVAGLTNLTYLSLCRNQIETMSFCHSDLSSLENFHIAGNPLTEVLLADATLSQTTFNAFMDGRGTNYTGIAELTGVLSLDMSGVDFAGISDLSEMYTMDDLESLLLAGATNLDGSQVVSLIFELNSLDRLDVRGLWNNFDGATQCTLNAWDAAEGNMLITGVPEPSTLVLLVMGVVVSVVFFKRRR